MNVKTWSEAGPAGGCDVRGLDVVECWNDGRRAALRVLRAHDDFADVTQDTFDHLEAKRVTMFFPFGPDSDMPGMRSGGDTGGGDEEDLDRGASSSDAGDGESDDAEIREALETESVGENSGPPRHSKFVQIGAKKVFKASAVKEFTGSHAGTASRDRLARVRGFTTRTGVDMDRGSKSLDDVGKTLQIGSPFATLFRLRADRQQPVKYCVGVLVVSESPVAGDEGAGQTVKGKLMKLVATGTGSTFEWANRKVHTTTSYSCSVALVIELDPTMDMDNMTYVFSMDEMTTTLNVLQEIVENVQGWAAVPDVRKPPRGHQDPLPLHDDLTCTSREALGAGEVLAASVDGKVECPLCFLETDPKKLLQHMAGHILENEDLQKRDTCGFCGGDGCKTWVVVPTKGKAASQIHSNYPLAPKTDSRKTVVAIGLKAAAKSTAATPCTNVPLRCLFCTPNRWLWKYCMSHHVREQHAASLAMGQADPDTVRFKASFDVGETERSRVVNMLRKGKRSKSLRASVVMAKRGKGKQRARAPQNGGVLEEQEIVDSEEEEEEEEEGEEEEEEEDEDEKEEDEEEEEGTLQPSVSSRGRTRIKKRHFALI
eukprot:jgi/Undpi1/11192/HiC_scaffold_30.g13490.m1